MSFEAGKLAQLADGAVAGPHRRHRPAGHGHRSPIAYGRATDFFPLTVDIEERTYAAGKIPGSFFRREGKSSDQAILTCRLIDRPLRPSFPDGFRNEVHVVGTIVGADQVNPHDVLAINAASAALMLSGIPFDGPIGAVRVAYTTEGEWIPHPTFEEGEESTFELVVAGRALTEDADSEIAIMMVEAGGTEKSWSYYEDGAPKVTEEVLAVGPRGGQDVDPRVHQPAAPPRRGLHGGARPHRDDPVLDLHRLPGRRVDPRARRWAPTPSPRPTWSRSKAERNAALDAAGEEIQRRARRRVRRPRRARSRRPSAR